MPKFSKKLLFAGGILTAISVACIAWLDNPPWAHKLFVVAWILWAGGILYPMLCLKNFNQFRIFAIGFVLFSFPGVVNMLGAPINFPWLEKIGIFLCLIGLFYAMLTISKKAKDSQQGNS